MTTTSIKPRTIGKGLTESEFFALTTQAPAHLIASNSKLSKSGIWQWTLPAFDASVQVNGKHEVMRTCPSAGVCASFCYACSGGYIFKSSVVAHTRNLQYYLDNRQEWVARMIAEIGSKRNMKAFRWHDSGDWFSMSYFMDACKVMAALPNVQFYCYTKRVGMFKRLMADSTFPANLTVIFSYGGVEDCKIDPAVDRHSKVFATNEDMVAAGYADTSEADDNAADPSKRCIGLVWHGNPGHKGSATGE